MAEWDIGFEIIAVMRMDVRNPNDKLVFNVELLADSTRTNWVDTQNRSQILAYFNVMAIRGKVDIIIEEKYPEVLHRLMWAQSSGKSVYELELLAKTKTSYSSETDVNSYFQMKHSVVHRALTFAFTKLSDAKIVGVFPALIKDGRTEHFLARFDAS